MLRHILEMRWRTVLVGAAMAGFALRLSFGLVYWVDKPLTNDEREYLILAENLSSGNGFTYGDASDPPARVRGFGRAPLYPSFLAVIDLVKPFHRDPQSTPVSVKVVQSVVGSATIVIIGLLGMKVAGPTAAAMAAMIAAVYPPFVWMCAFALSETLSSFLALACVAILTTQRSGNGGASQPRIDPSLHIRSSLFAGIVAGLTALTRPVMLLFIAMCTLWLAMRHRWLHAVVLVLAAVGIIAPWTIRNLAAFERVVIIAPQGGVNFWIGNHRLARGEGDLAANPLLKAADLELRQRHPGLDEADMERVYYRDALSHISADPMRWLALVARKAFYQWIPTGPSYRVHSARYRYASLASYLVLLPIAVAGLIVTVRRRRTPEVLFVLASSELIAALIFFPQERYRIPVIDPTIIILSAAALTNRQWHPLPRI